MRFLLAPSRSRTQKSLDWSPCIMPSVTLGLVRRCWRVRSATQRFLSCKITYFTVSGAGAPDCTGRKRCLLFMSWYTEALLAICRRAHAMEQSLTATKQTFKTRYTILVGLCAAACTAAVKLANLARSGDLSERQDPAASCARRRALTTHSQCQPRKDCVLYLNLQCPSY